MNYSVTIRITLGLTQKELAGILNISGKLLSQYENDTAVLPKEPNDNLNLFYRYMKLALSYSMDLNTMTDHLAKRKTVEALLLENKNQRDLISSQLKNMQHSNKEELAKKKLLWLLRQDNNVNSFIRYQKLEDCLRIPSESQEADIMSYKIKLSTLNFEKGKLELQWRSIQSDIDYFESHPIVKAAM